ncbi:unnamed protein product, partial [Polarella glacialis]
MDSLAPGANDTLQSSWLLICTFLIVSMQLGFAMLEVGSVREAHRMTVLAKNIMDSVVSCFAFSMGASFFKLSLIVDDEGRVMYDRQLYNWVFCATSVTICSGAMAERTHMIAYLFHAALMACVIYPPVAEAVWGKGHGFLYNEMHRKFHDDHHYHDCAGSGVVHLVGGVAALAGNTLLGRRIMRQDQAANNDFSDEEHGSPKPPRVLPPAKSPSKSTVQTSALEETRQKLQMRCSDAQEELWRLSVEPWIRRFDDTDRDKTEFKACNYLQVMGMFMLWVGWYGFNAGSSLSANPSSMYTAGLVSWNTTVAASAGGFGAFAFLYFFRLNLDTAFLCNGVLSGLVSCTASCDIATPVASSIIGLIAGLIVYPLGSSIMSRLQLDDPVDAGAVHACCGLFGCLAVAFCQPDCEELAIVMPGSLTNAQSIFCEESHRVGYQLVTQLWGCIVIVGWTLSISLTFWLSCALSERVRALELDQIDMAQELLQKLTCPGDEPTDLDNGLQRVANLSPLARSILKQHGWNGVTFQGGGPHDLFSLLAKLRQAQFGRLQTSLEVDPCYPVRLLVRAFHRCRPFREIAIIRIRIHPLAELSGLGVANTDGGRVYTAIQRAADQIAEIRNDHQTIHSPLKREVKELTMLVRSQEILLQTMMRGRNSSRRS